MIIHQVQQGSVEWMQIRASMPTASEFHNLITPLGKIRDGDMVRSYMARKVAEWWEGGPLPSFNSFDMDQGNILEDEALPWLAVEFGWDISRPGFITDDNKQFGCSPDGMIEAEKCGVEIKCPRAETHVGYLLNGGLPKDYVAQVQGSMLVTGLERWRFVSYRRNFPPLVLNIQRDEDFQANLAEGLKLFLANFESDKSKMKEIEGETYEDVPIP